MGADGNKPDLLGAAPTEEKGSGEERGRTAGDAAAAAVAAEVSADSPKGGEGGAGGNAAERLQIAAKINAIIRSRSRDASLVVTHLPLGRDIEGHKVVEHVEALTEGLDRALLIRGCGKEVVTHMAETGSE